MIKRVPGARLPSGDFRSILVAYDKARHPVSHLALAVTGPPAAGAKAEPLTDTLTLTVYRHRFLLGWLDRRFRTSWFADRYPAPGDALLPLKTKADAVSIPGSASRAATRAVQGGNGVVAVSYAATPATLDSGRRALDLRFEGLEALRRIRG